MGGIRKLRMANTQYAYGKSFEAADEVMPPNVIVAPVEGHDFSKGTQTREKNELLMHKFNIDYCTVQEMFRRGSSVFRLKDWQPETVEHAIDHLKVILSYCEVIEGKFWETHPNILEEAV